MILWHVTEFWKCAIFWVVMVLSDNFTVRVLKCHSDGKHHKSSWKRWLRGVWQCFINCPSFGPQLGFSVNLNVRAAKCRCDAKRQNLGKNEDSYKCSSILQIEHLLFSSGFSEMCIVEFPKWSTDDMYQKTVFCKLVIFWAVVGFSENLIPAAPKCRHDNKQQITWQKRCFRGVWLNFFKLAIFWVVIGLSNNFTLRALKYCSDGRER